MQKHQSSRLNFLSTFKLLFVVLFSVVMFVGGMFVLNNKLSHKTATIKVDQNTTTQVDDKVSAAQMTSTDFKINDQFHVMYNANCGSISDSTTSTSSGISLSQSGNNLIYVRDGTKHTITPKPKSGFKFMRWEGLDSYGTDNYTRQLLPIDSLDQIWVYAIFLPYETTTINFTSNNSNYGTVSPTSVTIETGLGVDRYIPFIFIKDSTVKFSAYSCQMLGYTETYNQMAASVQKSDFNITWNNALEHLRLKHSDTYYSIPSALIELSRNAVDYDCWAPQSLSYRYSSVSLYGYIEGIGWYCGTISYQAADFHYNISVQMRFYFKGNNNYEQNLSTATANAKNSAEFVGWKRISDTNYQAQFEKVTYEAEIVGGSKYKTLSAAFAAATSGSSNSPKINILISNIVTDTIAINSTTTKNITLTSNVATLVTRSAKDHIFKFSAGNEANLTIDGDIIFDGENKSDSANAFMELYSGTVTLKKCTIQNFVGNWGGGIWVQSNIGTAKLVIDGATIINCKTTSNSGGKSGGAILVTTSSTFEMSSGTITNCYSAGDGGALCIDNKSTGTITGGTIDGCYASNNGGAIGVYSGASLTISDIEIVNCSAKNGGAIYSSSSLTINGGTFSNNKATKDGGGAYVNSYATLTMTAGTINNNLATKLGGGICSSDGKIYLNGGTINRNLATSGGGIYSSGHKMVCWN